MNRKRHEVNNVRISDEEYGRLQNKYDLLRNEVSPVNKATATVSILNIPSISSTFFYDRCDCEYRQPNYGYHRPV